MKKFFERNKSLIIGFVMGAVMFTGFGGIAAYAIDASDVSFTPTDNTWSVEKVDSALNDLYTKANDVIDTYQGAECPGCVFAFFTGTYKCTVDATWSGCTNGTYPNTLSSSEYTTDYKSLNSNYFLGYVLGDDDGNGNKPILAHYACGIENNQLYCSRGYVNQNETGLTYKPNYYEKINKMNAIIPTCNAPYTEGWYTCYGSSVLINVNTYGDSSVFSGSSGCIAVWEGHSYCAVS